MFKYAAARALAYKHNTDLYLNVDVACADGYGIGQTYQLDKFNISASYATRSVMKQFDAENVFYAYYVFARSWLRELKFVRAIAKVLKRNGLNVSNIVPIGSMDKAKMFHEVDEDWRFKPYFLDLPDNILLKGYFPSYKYFDHIKKIIIAEFSLKNKLSEKSMSVEAEIVNTNSISVHFRRGDVASNPTYKSWYEGVVTDNYYVNAINFFNEHVENPHFFIFSNDIPWVKENFKFPGKVTYVDHNRPETGYEDLYLMSKCKHNVTTGCSSFSWWGAYLNANPNKIVLRAKDMNFHKHLNHTEDFYLPDWVVIES